MQPAAVVIWTEPFKSAAGALISVVGFREIAQDPEAFPSTARVQIQDFAEWTRALRLHASGDIDSAWSHGHRERTQHGILERRYGRADRHVAEAGVEKHATLYRETISRRAALERTVAWDREHWPTEIDFAQFDYAAEDAILSGK